MPLSQQLRKLPTLILLSLLFLLPCRSQAGTTATTQNRNQTSRKIQKEAAPAFLKEVNRSHYPYAHAVLAADIEHLEFFADGSRSGSDDVYITVLDEDGKSSQEILSFYVNRAYNRLDIELVEIIHNGQRRSIDIAANSREEAATGNTTANIYNPLEKEIKVFLPGLEIGDTIHYRVHRRQFKAIIANQIYGSILAQYDIPIHSYLYTITVPEKLEPRWLIKSKLPKCVGFRRVRLPGSQPRILLRWHFHNVPMIIPEPSMPSFKRVAMRLAYSTLPDWQTISDWYDRLVEPKLKPQKELVDKVAELCAGKPDAESKIAALFYFVARKIRYLGVNGESKRPGFEPHDINQTFSRRHGVCRDKAALLVGMLRTAKIKAAPVLIQVGDRLDPEIPLPWFNHAIVAVLDSRGQARRFLDPTSETSRQFLPDYERECSCLIAAPQSNSLELTPPRPPQDNLCRIVIEDQFAPDGHLSGKITVTCTGFNDTVMRSFMMNSGLKERRRFIQRFFLKQSSHLELERVQWSDPADTRKPFSFSGFFSLPARPLPAQSNDTAGNWLLIPPIFMEYPGLLDRWIIAKAELSERRYPLKLGYTFKTEITETMSFPTSISVSPPENFSLSNQVLAADLQIRRQPGRLFLQRNLTIRQTEVAAPNYPALLQLQNRNLKLSTTPLRFTIPPQSVTDKEKP